MMDNEITTWKIKRLKEDRVEELEDYIAVESPINIYVNNRRFVMIFASPQLLKELAVGHLVAEGIINSIEDISQIDVRSNNVLVTLKSSNIDLEGFKLLKSITTECTSIDNYVETLKSISNLRIGSRLYVKADDVFRMIRKMNEKKNI